MWLEKKCIWLTFDTMHTFIPFYNFGRLSALTVEFWSPWYILHIRSVCKAPRMLHEAGIGDQGICDKENRLCSSSAQGSAEFSNQTDVNTFPI